MSRLRMAYEVLCRLAVEGDEETLAYLDGLGLELNWEAFLRVMKPVSTERVFWELCARTLTWHRLEAG